ncbi:DinB family protein [Kineococcus sp. SYSU DK004]|uniref:DinB family protein n=1 Tax=Kineococcus sp. SYSU DK004 TaxID=3383125 RepID=UPI003D7C5E4E
MTTTRPPAGEGPDPWAAERCALLDALRAQRAHVLAALDGLPEQALRRPVLPSGWTCLGLVQHLALDVERFWFRAVVAGEDVDLAEGDGAWRVPTGTPAAAVLDAYRAEAARSDAVVAATPLDAPPARWPADVFPGLPRRGLRATVLHVLTETACHAGHLDAARELLDGHQHLVLT